MPPEVAPALIIVIPEDAPAYDASLVPDAEIDAPAPLLGHLLHVPLEVTEPIVTGPNYVPTVAVDLGHCQIGAASVSDSVTAGIEMQLRRDRQPLAILKRPTVRMHHEPESSASLDVARQLVLFARGCLCYSLAYDC